MDLDCIFNLKLFYDFPTNHNHHGTKNRTRINCSQTYGSFDTKAKIKNSNPYSNLLLDVQDIKS